MKTNESHLVKKLGKVEFWFIGCDELLVEGYGLKAYWTPQTGVFRWSGQKPSEFLKDMRGVMIKLLANK